MAIENPIRIGPYGEMKFAEKLRRAMGVARYSQTDLATALDVSQTLVSRWTRAINVPDIFQGKQIADTLGVSLDYLADDAADAPPVSDITTDERELLNLFRALGLTKEEALRRLASPPGEVRIERVYGPPPGYEHGVGKPAGVQDLTESRARRIQEKKDAELDAAREKSKQKRQGEPKESKK